MSSLQELQRNFLEYLRAPGAQMQGHVVDAPPVGAEQRLQIYADAYRLRLVDALRDNYPVLNALLGEEAFDSLGAEYLAAHPSHFNSVRNFGDVLAAFVDDTPMFAAQPIVGEMVRFEWMLRDVFDAADAPALHLQDLSAIAAHDWPSVKFMLHPTLRRIDLHWNTPALWRQLNEESTPDSPQRREFPVPWMAWRHELAIYFRSLEVDEAWAVDALRRNATFSEVCAGLCEWVDETHAPRRAAQFLHRWMNEGVLQNSVAMR